MKQVYTELGELILAIGTPWFDHTLSAVLQCVIDYDYFLLARYERGQPLNIVRSDFRDVQMQSTLHYLVTETYVAEPIYRLHNAGKTSNGVFDMSDLARQSQSLSVPVDDSLPHIIKDSTEEIGWRTVGWPEYQQETCILVHQNPAELFTVSLFNFGLTRPETASGEQLEEVYPIVSSAIARHFAILDTPSNQPQSSGAEGRDRGMSGEPTVTNAQVMRFFDSVFSVSITSREAEIFALLLQGDTIAAIADSLVISVHTARVHRRNVYRKIRHGRLLELINQFHAFNSQQLA